MMEWWLTNFKPPIPEVRSKIRRRFCNSFLSNTTNNNNTSTSASNNNRKNYYKTPRVTRWKKVTMMTISSTKNQKINRRKTLYLEANHSTCHDQKTCPNKNPIFMRWLLRKPVCHQFSWKTKQQKTRRSTIYY